MKWFLFIGCGNRIGGWGLSLHRAVRDRIAEANRWTGEFDRLWRKPSTLFEIAVLPIAMAGFF
jgi:hypothetical protein